jgi:hypothetical protein
MTAEEKDISGTELPQLPQEEIQKVAHSIFTDALAKIEKLPEFKNKLALEFLEQSGVGNSIDFKRKGYEYKIYLSRKVNSERIIISRFKGKKQEEIEVELMYNEGYDTSCTLFGGNRGPLNHAIIVHGLNDWREGNKFVQIFNNQETIDNTSRFIKNL